MTVVRPVSQIVYADFHETCRLRPLNNSILEWPSEKTRKNGEYVEGHARFAASQIEDALSKLHLDLARVQIDSAVLLHEWHQNFAPAVIDCHQRRRRPKLLEPFNDPYRLAGTGYHSTSKKIRLKEFSGP
jgi:hypothetical protein